MTDLQDLNRYRRIAQVAHQALADYASTAPTGDMFETFPEGCCGPASELVARYLSEAGEPALYASGRRGSAHDFNGHAWVEIGPVILDVTAGQFPEVRSRFLVTTSRTWHSQWKADELPRPPIVAADNWPAYPFEAWAAVKAALDQAFERSQAIHQAAA